MAVGSVVNAIAILRHLATSEPQGVNAIARSIDLSPSSCFNILKTLVSEEFVDFDKQTKVYGLGPAPFRLFAGGADFASWKTWLIERLEQLANHYGISCGLWEVHGQRLVLTDVIESPLSTRIHLSIGQRLPIYLGAMGRCIAAQHQLGRDEIGPILAELRWQTPPSVDSYLKDVAAARESGWSLDDGNYLRGVTTIASIITDERGKVSHCMTSSLFSGQHERTALNEIGEAMAGLSTESRRKLSGG